MARTRIAYGPTTALAGQVLDQAEIVKDTTTGRSMIADGETPFENLDPLAQLSDVILERGSFKRPAKEKLQEVVSITDFGVVGTDDDSDIVAEALATARTVRIPSGVTVNVRSDIVLQEGQALIGYGRTSRIDLKSNEQAANVAIWLANGSSVRGLRVREVGTTGRTGVYGTIFAVGVSGVTVDDVEVSGSSSIGIMFINSTDAMVSNCFVHDTQADGIHVQRGSKRVSITNCQIKDVGDDGIAFVSHGVNEFGYVSDCVASNCVITGVGTVGSGVGIIGAFGISVTGCRIKDTALAGIRIGSASFGAEGSTVGGVISIVGNQISGTGSGSTGERGGVFVEGCRYVTIKSNFILNPATTGISLSNAWADIDIHDNKIVGCGDTAIFVSAETKSGYYLGLWTHEELSDGTSLAYAAGHSLSIKDNTVRSAGLSGVYVSGDASHGIDGVSISGNEFNRLKTNATGGAAYGVFVSRATNVRLSDNRNLTPANPLSLMWYLDPATVASVGSENSNIPRKGGFTAEAAVWVGDVPHYRSTAFPTSADASVYGTFSARTVVWNDNPASGTVLWICTADTTPTVAGSWFPLTL